MLSSRPDLGNVSANDARYVIRLSSVAARSREERCRLSDFVWVRDMDSCIGAIKLLPAVIGRGLQLLRRFLPERGLWG